MKKPLLIITAVLLIAGLGYLLTRSGSDDPQQQPVFAPVTQGDLQLSLKEGGTLNAMEEITIKNQIDTRSLNILNVIPDGSYVKEGDFLIELDSQPLQESYETAESIAEGKALALTESQKSLEITQSEVESSVSQAEENITFAQMELDKFLSLDKRRQVEAAETKIETAKDQLNLAQQSYDASVMLESKGFETSSKVERDRLDLSSKRKQVATAELTLQILQQFDLPKSEKRLRNNVTNAQNKLTRTIAEGENKVSRAKAKQAAAQKAYQKAVDKLEEISTLLPLTTIHSEVEGYVLYPNERNRRIEQGQPVMRGQTLMRIPKMDDMKVDISVPEAFISALAVGQEAIVTIDSIQDASFSGKVSHIALLPTRSNNWLSNSVQKYKVTIDVEDTELPADIKPQISASAEILLDHLQDTLYVPIQSVHTIQGDQIVYKRTGKNAYEAQTVEIGKMNTNFMQILSGITAQDEVLITDPAADAIPALEEPDSQTPSSTDSTH